MSEIYDPGRLIALNYLEIAGATITATSEDGDRIADNLKDPDADLTWRSTSTADQKLQIRFDKKRPFNAWGLGGHNLTLDATVLAEYLDGVSVVASETINAHRPIYGAYGHPGAYLFAPYGYPDPSDTTEPRWPYTDRWRDDLQIIDGVDLTISDAGNGDGYMDVVYVTLGHSFSPGINFAWGYQCGWIPTADVEITPDGASIYDAGVDLRQAQAQWEHFSVAEATRINQLLLQARQHSGAIFWSGYPGRGGAIEQQNVMVAYPVDWTPPTMIRKEGLFQIQLQEAFFYG